MNWKAQFPKENRYFETENGILYKGEDIETMLKFPENIFDAIITDPPYGTTACKWDTAIPFEDMWREGNISRRSEGKRSLYRGQRYLCLVR